MDSSAAGMRDSALDLLAALLTGRAPAADDGEHNRRLLALLATSLAVLVGCGVALLFRRSSSAAAPLARQAVAAKPLAAKKEQEPDPDDGRQRVALFFGTQTGTAEGFAKALAEEAKARYDKAIFKVLERLTLSPTTAVISGLLVASASRGISDRPYSPDEHRLQLLARVHECHFFHQRPSPLRPACETLRRHLWSRQCLPAGSTSLSLSILHSPAVPFFLQVILHTCIIRHRC